MRYRSSPGVVEVDGMAQWARAAALDCAVIRPGLLAGSLLSGPRRHRSTRRWARRTTRMLGVDLTVSGIEPIDVSRSYVVAPLHESMFDPVAVLHLPLPLRFVLRSEILAWRGVGRYARATGQISADPEAGRAGYRSLLAGATARDAGDSLVVFPQGTVLGIETAFSGGAFRVAERTGQPVLPVVLTGSHRVWEHPFAPRLRFGAAVGMDVLAPVEADEIKDRGSEAIRLELQDEMKRVALSATMPAPRRFEPERDGWWDGYAYEIDPAFPELAERVASHRAAARA